jgi:hypothetical protein
MSDKNWFFAQLVRHRDVERVVSLCSLAGHLHVTTPPAGGGDGVQRRGRNYNRPQDSGQRGGIKAPVLDWEEIFGAGCSARRNGKPEEGPAARPFQLWANRDRVIIVVGS